MKTTAWLIAATVIASSVAGATPSFAQVEFGVGPEGPRVRVGPDRDRTERRYIERRYYDDRLGTGSIERCRTVTIREEDDDGEIVTRRVRRCR